MVNKSRGTYSFVAALLALALVLSACGNGNDNAAGTAGSASTPAGSTQPASSDGSVQELEPYEINWYYVDGPAPDLDLVLAEVNKYLTDKINATLKITRIDWGDVETKFPLVMASGEKIDLTFTSNWANDFRPNVAKKAFLELNDLLEQYGQDIKKVLPQSFIDGATINGKLYALATNKEIAEQPAYLINNAFVEKYGFELSAIKSYKDIEPMLKTMKENEPDSFGLSIGGLTTTMVPLSFDRILEGVPGSVDKNGDTTKIINEFETAEMQDYFATMRNWYQTGYIRKDAATVANPAEDAKTGKWFARTVSYTPYAELNFNRDWNLSLSAVPIQQPMITTGSTNGAMLAIPRSSENPERVMMFLNLLYTDSKLYNMLAYGIEGTHYVKTDDNTVELAPGVDPSNRKYASSTWEYGNMFLQHLFKGDPTDKWAKYEAFNQSAVPAPTLGFSFDPQPVMNEITAVRNAWNQYIPALAVGSIDTDKYVQEAIDKMKRAGSDTIIAEMQKQYDAWLASK